MRAISIEAVGVTKRFGAFTALDDVSLRIRPGAVHALLGENGAGKSTLVKCLLGYYRADSGSFMVNDAEVDIARPADADRLGLGMVYQHFTLVPSMTAAENLVMSRADTPALIDWPAERKRLDAFVSSMPFNVPLHTPVGGLSAGERQKIEILKQLYLNRRLLVLDEPTSTLTPQEADEALGLVRALALSGDLSVVIITHKLKEVAAFADDVTVLRRGKKVGGGAAHALSASDLTAMMIGEAHAPAKARREGSAAVAPRLLVQNLTTDDDLGRPGLSVQRLAVHPREIVGVAGVSGNGQKDLVEALGGQRAPSGGEIIVSGEGYDCSRSAAQEMGVRVLPEEPLRNGCAPQMTVSDNLNFRDFDLGETERARFWLSPRDMLRRARKMIASYRIRTPSEAAPIAALSGGNVQRAVLARELNGKVDLLIVANPCFGLDVKAVAEVRSRIVSARNAGTAVLLVSEDLDEILELADRIVVMRQGRIVYETAGERADALEIGGHMVGRA